AAKVGSCKQPSSKLSTGIPTVASCSSLRPPEKVISFKRFGLNRGRNDQTWEYEKSSLSSELAPGLTSGGEDAFPAEQSADDQLSQELERVKKELERVKKVLERVKGELADKTAQCEAYEQTIRAAGICLKDAAVLDSGDLGRD
ncbi:hypothetical protein EK904_002864, partial [Melospiza melodia maxima]